MSHRPGCYATGVTIEADFLCQKWGLPTEVDDLIMAPATFEFAGGVPTFTGI